MLRSHDRRLTGFTLIELLVVIAIIAILAAILFPVFARARAKAYQTTCLSNLKQIGLSFRMYAEDWGDLLPPGYPTYFNWSYGWNTPGAPNPDLLKTNLAMAVGALYPYMRNYQLWFCAYDVWLGSGDHPFGSNDRAIAGEVSYSFCTQWDTWWVNNPYELDPLCPDFMSPADILGKSPSQQGLMIDNGLPGTASNDPADYEFAHTEGSNVVYLDGHAKYLPWAQYATLHPPLVPYTGP